MDVDVLGASANIYGISMVLLRRYTSFVNAS